MQDTASLYENVLHGRHLIITFSGSIGWANTEAAHLVLVKSGVADHCRIANVRCGIHHIIK